jgi:small nuclear ribonucleoprotein (snRNP)-like protein
MLKKRESCFTFKIYSYDDLYNIYMFLVRNRDPNKEPVERLIKAIKEKLKDFNIVND